MFPPVKFHLETIDECASTQDLLLEKRGRPDFHGAAMLAKKQTAGRGRRGREWEGGEGNLALSLGLKFSDEALFPLLPFVCGLGLFASAKAHLPPHADLRLKWPNDLYLDGKKLAGIVSQGRQLPGSGAEVVVGMGMNLKSAPPDLDAIALAKYGNCPEPEEFAHSLLAGLEEAFRLAKDFPWLKGAWEKAARLQETRLTVVGENDSVRPLELLPTGELLVEKNGKQRSLSSEEVSLRFSVS
ncbi:MAG TPA: biotin--[acetyl-CoA-carboxylase] ligase [Bdellovibrionota bacterium]|jgi:BirA family biotin operon repressor/biotin-[acetyl-CoA-carboxylase] ligase